MMQNTRVKWDWPNEHVLITGGSSGLGRAMVMSASKRGAKITIVARNEDRTKEVIESLRSLRCDAKDVRYFLYDLSDPYGVSELFDAIVASQDGRSPTLLINNAGYNAAGFVMNTPIDVYDKNFAVNTLAPIALLQSALPSMLKNNHGGVVSIVSAAMYHSFPGISSYCARKFALGAVHESLEAELFLDGIQTLYVNPGGFQSRYWDHLDQGDRLKGYKYPKRKKDRSAAEVAEKIFDSLESGKRSINLSGPIDHLGKWLHLFAPTLFKRLLAKRNLELLKNRPKST